MSSTWQIIVAVIAIIAAVGWGAAWLALKNIVKNAKELEAEYKAGMADGTLSDDELKAMLPHLVCIIEDTAKLWQTLQNLVMSIIAIFRKKP